MGDRSRGWDNVLEVERHGFVPGCTKTSSLYILIFLDSDLKEREEEKITSRNDAALPLLEQLGTAALHSGDSYKEQIHLISVGSGAN